MVDTNGMDIWLKVFGCTRNIPSQYRVFRLSKVSSKHILTTEYTTDQKISLGITVRLDTVFLVNQTCFYKKNI